MSRASKIIVVVLLTISVFSIGVLGNNPVIKDKYWDRVPEDRKFNLTVRGYNGVTKLQISGIIGTEEAIKKMYKNEDSEEIYIYTAKEMFDDSRCLFIYVGTYNESAYFFPSDIAFTQGGRQWEVNMYTDVKQAADNVFSGEIKPHITTHGYVALPKTIDLNKPFRVWYNNDYDTVK